MMNILLRCGLLAGLVLMTTAAASAQTKTPPPEAECTQQTRLCIGVRSDARPFSYKSRLPGEEASDAARGPLRRAGYTGYMIRICDAVLAEMILDSGFSAKIEFSDIKVYDIDKAKKSPDPQAAGSIEAQAAAAGIVKKGAPPIPPEPSPGETRFSSLGKQFDILCDPATITNERRDEFAVSPPLFLTGGSYITRKGETPPDKACSVSDKPLIGLVGGTTAPKEGIRALLRAHELPRYETELINYLKGEEKSQCKEGSVSRIRHYDTHSEAAKAFCDGDFYYYVGDLEIITENVKMIPGCNYDNGTKTYTNDRYAVFGRARQNGDTPDTARQLLVARFFEILSQKVVFNPSVLDKAFSDTFEGVSPSRKLELFYWSVRGERE